MNQRRVFTYNQIEARYPRLIRHMQSVAVLSKTEALSAIQCYQIFGENAYGGEAVSHYGGCLRVIRDAINQRHWRNEFLIKNFIRYVLVNNKAAR